MTLIAAGLLGGCGQKGELMLPTVAAPAASAASAPAGR